MSKIKGNKFQLRDFVTKRDFYYQKSQGKTRSKDAIGRINEKSLSISVMVSEMLKHPSTLSFTECR